MENWFSLLYLVWSLDLREIMKCIKLEILLVFLILIISVGMVSATESVSTVSEVNNGSYLAINQKFDVDYNTVGDGESATFTDLDTDIQNAQSGVLSLTKDYKFDASTDNNFKSGVKLSSLTINGNGHTIDGNGLSRIFEVEGAVTLNNLKLINGHSIQSQNGGAILLSGGSLTAKHCQFENNVAESYGGAISVGSTYTNVPITVNDCTFKDNQALYHGGAINGKAVTVEKTTFDSNKVTIHSPASSSSSLDHKGLGGAIFAENVNVKNSVFRKNNVYNSGIYQIDEGGGAIVATHKLDVDGCNFTENEGLKGGAILAVAANSADLNPSNYVKIKNSRFISNNAFDGGAICSNYNITIDRSMFDKNVATGYGGGAINTGYMSNDNYFTNSVFTNNTADNYGGAISTSHSHIRNCTFQYNSARHAGAIFSLSFDIAKSVLIDNVATVGNNVIVVDGYKKDDETYIPASELIIYRQNEVHDFTVDVLNGQDSSIHYIESGKYAGYQQYCVEEHLYLPSHTEGVITYDLSYITNSIDRSLVSDYIKIMFYLKDAYPGKYDTDSQSIIWIFTDQEYWNSPNEFVREIIAWKNANNITMDKASYVLPNGTHMEYDMQLFLTPTDRQNMVLFKSSQFTPTNNESVIKQTLDQEVTMGDIVEFRITVTNTGNTNLTEVFVRDIDYSKGLVYKDWKAEVGKWSYRGNGLWILDEVLEAHDSAGFLVYFNTTEAGKLRNNITSGYMNITMSNSTDSTIVKVKPKMSIIKLTNDKVVRVGEELSFTIIVRNECDYDITGVYVIDNKYTEGIEYEFYSDPDSAWSYKGNNRWEYNGILQARKDSSPLILYFIATTTGVKYNTAIAGNNLTNETVNSTNTTKVIKENKTKNPKNDTPHEDDKNKTKKQHHYHHSSRNATGNPLFALILVLISLGVITFKRRFKR